MATIGLIENNTIVATSPYEPGPGVTMPEGFSLLEGGEQVGWVRNSEGEAFHAPEPAAPGRFLITKLEIKRRLQSIGKWQEFKDELAKPENEDLADEWNACTGIYNDDPRVSVIAMKLSLTEGQLASVVGHA